MTRCARTAALLPATAKTEEGQGGGTLGLRFGHNTAEVSGKPPTEGRRARVGLRDRDSGRCLRSELGFRAVGLAATIVSADRQKRNNAKRSFLRDAHL